MREKEGVNEPNEWKILFCFTCIEFIKSSTTKLTTSEIQVCIQIRCLPGCCLLSFDKIGRDGRRIANDEDDSNDDNDVALWHNNLRFFKKNGTTIIRAVNAIYLSCACAYSFDRIYFWHTTIYISEVMTWSMAWRKMSAGLLFFSVLFLVCQVFLQWITTWKFWP